MAYKFDKQSFFSFFPFKYIVDVLVNSNVVKTDFSCTVHVGHPSALKIKQSYSVRDNYINMLETWPVQGCH